MENQDTNICASRKKVIVSIIAAKYSIDDQIAILRQKDTKPEEYKEFYDFVEKVKEDVTKEYNGNIE